MFGDLIDVDDRPRKHNLNLLHAHKHTHLSAF